MKLYQALAKLLLTLGIIDRCVEQCNCQQEDAQVWKAFWDHQIYKALEAQYHMGLEALAEELPAQKVEIIFQQKQLRFKPM